MDKKFPAIVEFYFGSEEESYLVQILIESKEDIDKLLLDVKNIIKKLFERELKEELRLCKEEENIERKLYFINSLLGDGITISDFIYDLEIELKKKGWKTPNIYKVYSAGLWGSIDVKNGKYKSFYGKPANNELEKLIQEVTIEVIDKYKSKIDELIKIINEKEV